MQYKAHYIDANFQFSGLILFIIFISVQYGYH